MTILRDLSVIWAMINIAVFFLIIMEYRIPLKRLMLYSLAYLMLLVPFQLWYLFSYGPSRMAQSLFVTMLLPTVCFYFFFSKYRDGRFLYSFFLICDLNADLTIITYLLDLALPGVRYLWMFLLRLVLFPLLNLAAYKWLRQPYLKTQHSVERGWMAFALTAALFELLAIRLFSYPNMIENRPDDLLPLIFTLALTLLTNWYIFTALRNQQALHEMREKEQLLQLQTEWTKRQAEQTTQLKNALSIERHDLRHRFHALSALLLDGKTAEALEYLRESDENLSQTELSHYCKNTLLDAVFSYYFSNAKELGVQVEAELDIPEKLSVDAAELSTVFANALENALNAVSHLPEQERIIRCRCIRYPQLMFRVSNPYRGDIKWDADGLPIPPDRPFGTGSRSIAAYCEKHGAWCDYRAKDGWFSIQLTQP